MEIWIPWIFINDVNILIKYRDLNEKKHNKGNITIMDNANTEYHNKTRQYFTKLFVY